jgi:hypothetical protein
VRIILGALAVDPSIQRRGVASRLLALIEHAAHRRRAPGITLGSMDDAVGFYLRMGYKAVLLVQFVASGAHAEEAVAAVLSGPLAGYACLRSAYNGIPQLFVQVETVDMDLLRRVEGDVPGVSAGWVMNKDFYSSGRVSSVGCETRPVRG